jgi:hypothetical protein
MSAMGFRSVIFDDQPAIAQPQRGGCLPRNQFQDCRCLQIPGRRLGTSPSSCRPCAAIRGSIPADWPSFGCYARLRAKKSCSQLRERRGSGTACWIASRGLLLVSWCWVWGSSCGNGQVARKVVVSALNTSRDVPSDVHTLQLVSIPRYTLRSIRCTLLTTSSFGRDTIYSIYM